MIDSVLFGDITTPIFGFVGVLVGALIAASVDMRAQRRNEQREKVAELRALKATARLLKSELEEVIAYMSRMVKHGEWLDPPGEKWLALWDSERNLVAGGMRDDVFDAVALAFFDARLLDLSEQRRGEGTRLSPEETKQIEGWQRDVEAARSILEREAKADHK